MVGETIVDQEGLATILRREKRYDVCGGAHGFYDAVELIRKHRPHVLLIEPFLADRDAIRWIEDLAREFPRTRILIVSRQAERVYAERALQAGAAGYWMKNGSALELLHAVETVMQGGIYVSPVITLLALKKFAHRPAVSHVLDALTDRELMIFASIASGQGAGGIAKDFGVSRKTVEAHCSNIKVKLHYPDAESLRRGARELLTSV